MNLRPQDKLTKLLERTHLSKKLVGLVGIVGCSAAIAIWASNQHSDDSVTKTQSNRVPSTQNSSEAIAPYGTSTTSSPAPTPSSTKAADLLAPIPETTLPNRSLPAPKDILPPLGSDTLPQNFPPVVGTTNPYKFSPPNRSRASSPADTTTTLDRSVPNYNTITRPNSFASNKFSHIPSTTPSPNSSTADTTHSKSIPSSSTTIPAVSNQISPPADIAIAPNKYTSSRNYTATSNSNLLSSKLKSKRLTTTNNTRLGISTRTPDSTASSTLLPAKLRQIRSGSIATNSNDTQTTTKLKQAIDDANSVAVGLVVAKQKGQLKPYTKTWKKAQDAIFWLRRGKTRQEAADRSGISPSTLTQLIEWAQNRPSQVRQVRSQSIATNASPVQTVPALEQAIDDANAAAFGLAVARREGQLKPYTKTWKKAQSAISLLRRGKTRQEAARRAGISPSMLTQLIEWGQNRP